MNQFNSDPSESYRHTQKSPLFFLLILIAGLMSVLAWNNRDQSTAMIVLTVVAGIFITLAFSFFSLTTSIQSNRLFIRYGPIPLFGTSLDLIEIDDAIVGRTSVIDGWGIHYIPMRGWTFNLWGFSCVKIAMGNSVVRVGTDDAENLAAAILKGCEEVKGKAA